MEGFTIMELLIAVVLTGIVAAVGHAGFRQFNEAITTQKAIRVISADLSLTRSYAIRRRSDVSLVADESNLSYTIRDVDGTVFAQRDFQRDSGLPLTMLNVAAPGDSVTFNSRGLLVGVPGVEIEVGRHGRVRNLFMNALGRVNIRPRS